MVNQSQTQTLDSHDILVILYPNVHSIESVLVIDPFDKKTMIFEANSIEEVKKVLRENLPFCSQNHEPIIHLGSAYILEWEDLPLSKLEIIAPNDIEKLLS
jgi:hypothetical protein